jgi:flagella basal body P-ring formation protein FlgA
MFCALFIVIVKNMATAMTKKSLGVILLFVSETALAGPMQSVPFIQDAVNGYINANLAPDGHYEIGGARIDPRLQLPQCEQPLQVFIQSGELKPGRNTLGVRCNAEKGWTIYSIVSIKSFKNVLVLNRSLQRSDVIRAEYLNAESRDIGLLQQGYMTELDDVVDKQAVRNIPAGSVLSKLHITELTLVKRGERVNIQSGKAGVLISATGTAMADGAKGQKINVKNLSSQRVIQATVVDSGQVSVYF